MSDAGTPNRNLYDLLGIAPNADPQEVRRAYRALARHLHPDLNEAPDAADRFNQLSQAYTVLNDPARRRLYDEARRLGNGAPARSPLPPRSAIGRGVLRGADVEAAAQLSLREAVFGVETRLEVGRREVCVVCVGMGVAKGGATIRCIQCNGTGGTRRAGDECRQCHGSGVVGDPPCPQCSGSGRRQGLTALVIQIPPGVDHGQVLRLKGDGDAGPRNGPRGDLLLRIAVEPDPVLQRSGIDIIMNLPLSKQEAAEGCHVEVPTLRGPKRLRVPPGTEDRTILRIGGAGLRLPGSWHKGDQFVTVQTHDGMRGVEQNDDDDD